MRIETSYAQPAGVKRGLSVVGRLTANWPVASKLTVIGPEKTTAESES